MRRVFVAVIVSATLAGGPLLDTARCAEDPELAKGVALVDDGEYDSAILALDTVARRLARDPKETRDLSQAFKLFQSAASQNDPWGLNNLGGMYEMGWGTTADKARALDLYKQALAQGNSQAQQNIDRLAGKTKTTAQ